MELRVTIMKLYRYMYFQEFEKAYLHKLYKFRYSAVWADSLESLYVKSAESVSACKNLIDLYRRRYPNISNSDIYTEITHVVALSLQTRCQCWCKNGNSSVFWKRSKDYICLGVEYVEDDVFLPKYKVKGHDIQYIKRVDLEKIVDFFEQGRFLSDLQIVKDKDKYKVEEEYRLVATPLHPEFPLREPLFSHDVIADSDDALIRSISDYVKWAEEAKLIPHDEDIPLQNLEITSIKVHPEMSPELFEQLIDFCNKHSCVDLMR